MGYVCWISGVEAASSISWPGNRMKRVFAHMTRYPRLHAALRENEDGKG
jgi:hypothetical protein